ncbi:MAG TPA: hypothetical protein VFU97_14115 [Xanthobacteraceae bacterium]|nr:hypothetical protein [Xanthobacteraceae bacterium]
MAATCAGMTAEVNLLVHVMAGLVPAIHVFQLAIGKDVDARDERGHDGGGEPS